MIRTIDGDVTDLFRRSCHYRTALGDGIITTYHALVPLFACDGDALETFQRVLLIALLCLMSHEFSRVK